MKEFFIPTKENKYDPPVTGRVALTVYTLILFVVNIVLPAFIPSLVSDVSASSITPETLISLTNIERENSGLNRLTSDSRLAAAARAKAADMLSKDYWDHFGPNGETPWQFISGAGYVYVYAGENLAKGFVSSEGVHQAWMASPTHRANIVNSNYKDIGIAVVEGTLQGEDVVLVVQMFGAASAPAIVEEPVAAPVKPIVEKPTSQPSKPLPSNEKGEIKSISITKPVDDDVVNDPALDFEGTVEGYESNIGEYSVILEREEVEVASSTSESGSWEVDKKSDWEEGEHIVTAYLKGSDDITDTVKFIVDSTPPILGEESLAVYKDSNGWNVLLTPTEELDVVLNIGTKSYNLPKDANEVYSVILPENTINQGETEVIIFLTDVHGNTTEEDISHLFIEKEGTLIPVVSGNLGGISGAIKDFTARVTPKMLFNIGFALLLLIIIGVQLYHHHDNRNNHKYGTHTLTVVLLVLLIFVSTFVELNGWVT